MTTIITRLFPDRNRALEAQEPTAPIAGWRLLRPRRTARATMAGGGFGLTRSWPTPLVTRPKRKTSMLHAMRYMSEHDRPMPWVLFKASHGPASRRGGWPVVR